MSIIGPRPALWNQYDLIEEREKYGANDILLLFISITEGVFKESPLGPKRKYYTLTQDGEMYVSRFYQVWKEVEASVESIFGGR